MDTQVQRVVQWREQKRKAGYQPLTVWLKADVKHLIEDLASQSRQEIAEVVSEAIRVYAGQHLTPAPPDYVDTLTVRRLVAEYVSELSAGQIVHAPAPDVPRPTPRLPQDAVLLRGEYGWRAQAIRTAARDLIRFTCEQMARHLQDKPDSVQSTLAHLVKRGDLTKKGRIYFWPGSTTPDEKA